MIDLFEQGLIEECKLNNLKEDKKTIITELSEVERWKWIILGAVMSSGFLLGKLELSSILSFIK